MAELNIPADVEQAIIDDLPDLVVGTKIPADPKPPLFVRVVAAGGYPQTMVSDAFTAVIEVYAKKESEAQRSAATIMARLVSAATRGRMGGVPCHRVDVAGLPQNYPNPTVPGYYRYTMTLTPVLRRRTTTI